MVIFSIINKMMVKIINADSTIQILSKLGINLLNIWSLKKATKTTIKHIAINKLFHAWFTGAKNSFLLNNKSTAAISAKADTRFKGVILTLN
jgi:hypothetical protein